MSYPHQDWKPVTIVNKKKQDEKQKAERGPVPIGHNTTSGKKVIEDGDVHKTVLVGKEIGQKILQARTAKGWKQKDVAQKLNMNPSDYQKIENGSAIRNNQQLSKIGRVLAIKLTGKKS